MGIPVIEEIIDGVKWLIDMFLHKLPTPLKFLMFLFMLIIFGSVISAFIHLTGVHCNSDREVMVTSPLSFFSNIKFMTLDENDVYDPEAYTPESAGQYFAIDIDVCVRPICNVYADGYDYHWANDNSCINQTIEYRLQSSGDYFGCVICNKSSFYVEANGFIDKLSYVCDGDAVKIPYDDMNWFQRTFCDEEHDCMPPINYYYDSTTGLYTCNNLDVCGSNVTNETAVFKVDELLLEKQAYFFYDNPNPKDYKKLIYIQCDSSFRPDLTFYGINLFSYKIWLFLIVIYILVMVLLTIKKR